MKVNETSKSKLHLVRNKFGLESREYTDVLINSINQKIEAIMQNLKPLSGWSIENKRQNPSLPPLARVENTASQSPCAAP